MAAEPRSLSVLHLIVFPNYTLDQAPFWFLKVQFVRACAYVLVLSESWQKYVYGYACTHAHTRTGWGGLVTEPQTCSFCHLGLAHDCVCSFSLLQAELMTLHVPLYLREQLCCLATLTK